MDNSTITALVTAILGSGAGTFFGRWLGHKERAAELQERAAARESDRYWRLVDEQQAEMARLTARVDAQSSLIAAQQQQIATLQSEVHELRTVRGKLEADNSRLRGLLAAHGIQDPLASVEVAP